MADAQAAPEPTLHRIALDYVSAMDRVERAQRDIDTARQAHQRATTEATALGAKLTERIGNNVPTRVFKVTALRVLIVDKNGIRLVDVEPEA